MPSNLDLAGPNPLTTPVLAASQNDWGPDGSAGADTWYVSASTAVNVTGIAGGAANRLLRLVNVGNNTITLKSQSSSSAAANRFLTTADIALDAGEALTLTYVSGTSVGWSTLDAGAGASSAANLSITSRTSTTLGIASSTGTTATVPVATTSLGGLLTAADKTKLDAISGTNTGDQAASGVAVTATGNISSTTVQAALQEIQGDIDLSFSTPPCTQNPTAYAGSTALQASNQTMYGRVINGAQTACSKIRLYIGASSGNICVSVYAAGATPVTRVATSGSVASPGTGPREITISPAVDITPGMWIAVSADNTSVTFGRSGGPQLTPSVLGTGFQYYENAFPAPNPASPVSSAAHAGYILIGVQ